MIISLLTDAPKHNLALMKISAWHKQRGDKVMLNFPLLRGDKIYGSYLFREGIGEIVGGAGVDPAIKLPPEIEECKPDYDLYPIDYSLGYTWRYCPRKCEFCKVPKMNEAKKHKSIWDFHDPKFKKICLLNNNTFSDPDWRETFEEIWDADLSLIEHGFDLRLLDEEKAEALKRTRFCGQPHFAWDLMREEKRIIAGLELLKDYRTKGMVYVLMGFETTLEEDIYRCQKIQDMGFDPFPMLFKETPALLKFRRMIYLRYYRKSTIQDAWEKYK